MFTYLQPLGNFYTFALLELFLHCYTLEKKHFARYPWTILPKPNFFYTSTASAASDKYHVCVCVIKFTSNCEILHKFV